MCCGKEPFFNCISYRSHSSIVVQLAAGTDQVGQCCLCSQLAGDAQWDAWQRAAWLAAPSGTVALLSQSGLDAASC
jgi:hypothetical protein